MKMVRLINHLLAITIVSIISCVSVVVHAQEISNGTYIGHKRGVVPKYIIMEVNDDSIILEMFTRWQGSWLPCIGSWDEAYKPQLLQSNANGTLTNESIFISTPKPE